MTGVHSTAAYNVLIDKIEVFHKALFFAIGISCSAPFVSAAPYSILRYYMFNRGSDSFYLFAPAWFPFDWQTPFGYLAAWFAQFAGCIAIAIINNQFISAVFGSCWLFIFITEDMTNDVFAFNVAAAEKAIREHEHEHDGELRRRFCDLVQVYSDAKQ